MSEPLINEIRTQAVHTILNALNNRHVEGDLSHGPRGNITQDVPDSLVQTQHLSVDGVRYEYKTYVHVSVSRRPL